jgi:hypothetical protein
MSTIHAIHALVLECGWELNAPVRPVWVRFTQLLQSRNIDDGDDESIHGNKLHACEQRIHGEDNWA